MRLLLAQVRLTAIAVGIAAVLYTSVRGDDAGAIADYDQLLDARVRDGFVYYRALKADRRGLDGYVRSLATAEIPDDRPAQIAFWLNAYNAVVLQAVVDHYPITTRTASFPARSIRQIAGVFEENHRIAGRSVSLDRIEQSVLPGFRDPRVFLALGRGAAGGGRLRGEIYAADRIDRQLEEQATECATRDRCVRIDHVAKAIRVNAIFSWRRAEFVNAYARESGAEHAKRPPIEKAVLGFITPRIVEAERVFLATHRLKIEYLPFDWSLNDLALRRR